MKKFVISTILTLSIAAPVLAADSYIGLSAGQNKINDSSVKASTGFTVFAGYSYNEYIGGEISYVNFGSADTDPASSVTIKGSGGSVAAVGSLPLGRDFSLLAKVGYASTSIEPTGGPSDSKSDIAFGVGAQYNLGKNLGFRLGYDNYRVGENNTKDSALISIAALMKF